MKKPKAKASAKAADETSTGDLTIASALARQKVIQALPDIIDAIIGKAADGSYLHANFLFAFAGIDQGQEAAEAEREQSLAELLLSRLDLEAAGDEEHVVKSSSEPRSAQI